MLRILVLCTGNRCRLYIGFDDPDSFSGSSEEILCEFRRVRDGIGLAMRSLVARK